MAFRSSIGVNRTPANAEKRNVWVDKKRAIEKRIAEYKAHGQDTAHLEYRLGVVDQHLLDEASAALAAVADRADCATGVADQEKIREERKAKIRGEVTGDPASSVPDQTLPSVDTDAFASSSVPDQTSPWPAKEPIPAITPPPQDPAAAAKRADAEAKKAADLAAEGSVDWTAEEQKAAEAKKVAPKKAATSTTAKK